MHRRLAVALALVVLVVPSFAQIAPLSQAPCCGGGAGGSPPAGSGSELQFRSDAATFGAVTSSSVSGANVTLGGTLGGITQLNVDSVRIDNDTISATVNGPLVLTPGASYEVQSSRPYRLTAFGQYVGLDADARIVFNGGEAQHFGRAAFQSRILGKKGADVASANDVTLGDGNAFDVTGTTQINTIATTNWTVGSTVVLQFDASVTVANNTAGTGAVILLAGAANFSATAGDTLTLMLHESAWRETARSVL